MDRVYERAKTYQYLLKERYKVSPRRIVLSEKITNNGPFCSRMEEQGIYLDLDSTTRLFVRMRFDNLSAKTSFGREKKKARYNPSRTRT